MKIRELLSEAAAPNIGRKYQHIEDLVFTNGSDGGIHAAERLRDMGSGKGGSLEIKWDGSPVIYWGRDNQGRFSMIPKNAWEYLKRGKTQLDNGVKTVMYSPEDIKSFILGTGKPGADRDAYASQLMSLWPYLEKASPEKGYVEGGLLFYPGVKPNGERAEAVLNPDTGEYDFTPNITSFHIGPASPLFNRIKRAKVMVAVTGYYDQLGSSEEGRLSNTESLSTPEVIVQGTTYIEKSPGIDNKLVNYAEAYIEKNANLIDSFLAPKPGLSKPGDVLYKFFNQNLRVVGVKEKFKNWATQNLSAGQAAKVTNDPGLDVVLTAVENLTKAKYDLINRLKSGTHGGIRQTKPEGYAQAHPGGQFKKDLPGQFVKAIDQDTWAPRKD